MTVQSVLTGRLSRPVIAAAVAVAGLIAVRVANPVHNDVPLCPFHAVTGLQCPLCGGLRAAYELSRFDVVAAVRDNALFVGTLPLLLAYWLFWLRQAKQGQPERRFPRAAIGTSWAVAAAFVVVRNLPGAEWLRPS